MEQFMRDLQEAGKFTCWFVDKYRGKIRESRVNAVSPLNIVAMQRNIPHSAVGHNIQMARQLGLWDFQFNALVASCENYRYSPYFNAELRQRVLDTLRIREVEKKQ